MLKSKQWIIFLASVLAGFILLESCVHEPPGMTDINPDPSDSTDTVDDQTDPCDSDRVYFAKDILPIFERSCAFSGCHNAASAEDGVILESYESVMNSDIVRPFRLDNSDLYEVITEDDPDKRMPRPPANKLSSDEISAIASWILQGAENDSCDWDQEVCDLNNVSYQMDVRPILDASCMACHSASVASGGVNLESYSGVVAVAETGRLLGAVRWSPGFQPMPQGGNQLDSCSIATIEQWVADGTPQN